MQVKKHEAEAIFRKLRIEHRHVKHNYGWFRYEGRPILPVRFSLGRGEMPGKVGDKFRQSFKVSEEQFRGLVACPVTRDGYIEILKQKNLI